MTSLRQRLIVWTLAGITLFLAGNGIVIYVIVRGRLRSEMDQTLASIARSTAERVILEMQRPEPESEQPLLSGVVVTPWDPDRPPPSDAPQRLWERLRAISPHVSAMEVSGLTGVGRSAPELIRLLGRTSVCVARLSRDREASRAEIDALIEAATEGDVDVAVLGKGAISSGAYSVDELLQVVEEVREHLPPGVALTACEPRDVWLSSPELVQALDVLHASLRPFDEGVSIDRAVPAISCWLEELRIAARGRTVVTSDLDWPWTGEAVGAAVPSPENALRFLTEFTTWARLNDAEYLYLSSPRRPIDEILAREPDTEVWGLLDERGGLEPGVGALLESALATVGPPELVVAQREEIAQTGNLGGSVRNVRTFDHRVVVYLRSGGGWWNKPSFASPITSIQCDGTWLTDVTTGEGDDLADLWLAFLVPAGYTPPLLQGAADVPDELFAIALDVSEVRP